ncbi:MAG: hypothetical protein IPG64_12805 [Haliea sp.]|nr:hypothetical protein [Haliea sp.]
MFFSLDSTAEFFRSFERDEAAFLAATFSKRQGLGWFWEKCLPFLGVNELYGALFPLTRLSGPAIDHLQKRRIALEDRYQSDKERIELWPNDECFVSSMLTADGFACKDLASGPIAGLFGKFSTDTPYLLSCLQSENTQSSDRPPSADTREIRRQIHPGVQRKETLRQDQAVDRHCDGLHP